MNGLDVVAVEVTHEPAVVALVVFGPDPRLMQDLDTFGTGRFDEGVHLFSRLRTEADVDVLVGSAGIADGTEPEARKGRWHADGPRETAEMSSIGWLPDASEGALRAALASAVPELAGLPMRINPRFLQSNPLYWSASAVVGDAFVVKYAWSEVRATRLWREGVVLQRLRERDASLALPDIAFVTRDPALVVTRLVIGEPLSWEWTSALSDTDTEEVGRQLAQFLVRLHDVDAVDVLADLPAVTPTAQANTEGLRGRFRRLVDKRRARVVLGWCDWVDDILGGPERSGAVLAHGDLHGYNQVWDRATSVLRAVVDFEESGIADPHFDLRYLPGNARGPALVRSVMHAYESLSGTRLAIERVMAWNVLTHLGDALWRTEAGVELPGGGTAVTWVDDLEARLAALNLP